MLKFQCHCQSKPEDPKALLFDLINCFPLCRTGSPSHRSLLARNNQYFHLFNIFIAVFQWTIERLNFNSFGALSLGCTGFLKCPSSTRLYPELQASVRRNSMNAFRLIRSDWMCIMDAHPCAAQRTSQCEVRIAALVHLNAIAHLERSASDYLPWTINPWNDLAKFTRDQRLLVTGCRRRSRDRISKETASNCGPHSESDCLTLHSLDGIQFVYFL